MIPLSTLFEAKLLLRGRAHLYLDDPDKIAYWIALEYKRGESHHLSVRRDNINKKGKFSVGIDFATKEEHFKTKKNPDFKFAKGDKVGSFDLKGDFEEKNVDAILILRGIFPGTYRLTSEKKLMSTNYFMEKV